MKKWHYSPWSSTRRWHSPLDLPFLMGSRKHILKASLFIFMPVRFQTLSVLMFAYFLLSLFYDTSHYVPQKYYGCFKICRCAPLNRGIPYTIRLSMSMEMRQILLLHKHTKKGGLIRGQPPLILWWCSQSAANVSSLPNSQLKNNLFFIGPQYNLCIIINLIFSWQTRNKRDFSEVKKRQLDPISDYLTYIICSKKSQIPALTCTRLFYIISIFTLYLSRRFCKNTSL